MLRGYPISKVLYHILRKMQLQILTKLLRDGKSYIFSLFLENFTVFCDKDFALLQAINTAG